ncbi:hypothetical protein B0O80DRAFT_492641 [Mortierella sp. GBAus27b]|nr:hypothetical protein BGX31_011303 [Mortierella sp. GBA43]KAI8363510.1 hypothetical protein B0O80DRAFT_492641 [Mortierella sp. GBAus27b]
MSDPPQKTPTASDMNKSPTKESGSREGEWISIQTTITQIQDQQNQPQTKVTQATNATGNAAFAVGKKALTVKNVADTGAGFVKKVLGDSENPILSNMIQLADKLVDVGKAVPLIAPAFVILKIIIDIEQKAREVDEKCQDLMERINFMISHVLVLERIEVMDTLRSVLLRVQETLKEAAALIEAYRKQGKIARRLKTSNTQNFETMAGKITSCSSDLMMSLQIQQTGDLSILKRAVPRDLVAENFIKDHGGQDAINNDPALVRQFAEKMHLAMSDQVMEQMQSNMQELMIQNQNHIEAMIKDTSSNNVAVMIKAIATQQREWEAERKLICVQCNKDYNVSTNGPESCGFHSAVGNNDRYHCCEKTSPCKRGYHQPEHHSKYPYSNFYPWSYGLLGYSDTVDYWVNIKDFDLEIDGSAQIVRVGQLIRWRTWGELVTTPLMMVNIGHVQDDLLHYLEIFDIASLEDERRKVLQTGNTLIFKNASPEETTAYSMGEWVLDQETQQITGIKLTTKVTSSKVPTVCVVPVDPLALKMPGGSSVEYLSKGGWEVFKPDCPYEFPETLQLGPVLRETRLREPRTFKTKSSSPNNHLVLIPTQEMVANNNARTARLDVDRFLGHWRGLNKAPLSSQTQIILLSAKAEYRLVGEEEYKPVNYFGLRGDAKFPLSVAPSQAIDIPFEFTVDKPEIAKNHHPLAINFAHLTIHHPLRVRITFTDIEGDTITQIQEYVHPICGVQPRKPEDIGYFYVDDVDFSWRTVVRIKKPTDPKKYFLGIEGNLEMTNKVTEIDLHKIVYRAQITGITEVDMKMGANNLGVNWTIWALVDLSCRRVYGFKVILQHGSMTPVKYAGTLGYAPCPFYGGDNLETRPIQYAQETKTVPLVVHRDPIVVVEDDTVDDDIDPVAAPAPTPVSVPAATPVMVPAAAPVTAPSPAPVATPSAPVTPSVAVPAALPAQPPTSSAETLSTVSSSSMALPPTTPAVAFTHSAPVAVVNYQHPGNAVVPPSASPTSITLNSGYDMTTPKATTAPTPVSIPSPAPLSTESPVFSPQSAISTIESLQVKVAALEARLEANERQDAFMTKILALERKLEEMTTSTTSTSSDQTSADSRLSTLENRLASMDQKLDSMNINLRLLDGNASRLALSLEKIATLLAK